MTALKQFERLESPALWRETPKAQRRDVIVSFGDASLMIADTQERALSHWSLAAIVRQNPDQTPALFIPGADSGESLEISDPLMIEALEKIMQAITRARPKPGRLRGVLLLGSLAIVVALLVFWMPKAIVRHTASVVPETVRSDIGNRVLARLTRVSGKPCAIPSGKRVLNRFETAVFPDQPAKIIVLPSGVSDASHLPGHLYLVNRALIEDYEDPYALAGYLLAEATRADNQDPLERLLEKVGPLAAFRLLTTGTLPDDALDAFAEDYLTTPAPRLDDQVLLARFEASSLPSSPYAYALDISGETTLALIEADPMRGKPTTPLLSDGKWVQLQGICGE